MSYGSSANPTLGSPVSYKIIGILVFFTIALYVYSLNSVDDPEVFEITDGLYAAGALACGIYAIVVGLKYRGSEIFGKTYFALGLGFLMLFVGDVVLNFYEIVMDIDPYPSMADVFYFAYYPFAIFHLIVNIKHFKKKIDNLIKLYLNYTYINSNII